ncbi:MAG: prolyl oligopeptidase family serine peptidase [candidate division KSB1 bacterium]|nr:prolyl oligopeptidase family serine peptidase [candidate division KSB1 bacterium]MDZ7273746.1 prolyl oligopeptidase family serine peptidase [candidate division KSB1 bacterium]MDZ7285902.1 prolyl oligopeptidase family serine peptidase [candidate division KSB1 bacterium]MDZ7298934.1 prolyl oligopeptidase family serine peptidase [candidate division KSB1 bacterium]MDZ7307609.1 prolyl oligopeptidase family serine peptidase [candidate division KSB1 bacterium]
MHGSRICLLIICWLINCPAQTVTTSPPPLSVSWIMQEAHGLQGWPKQPFWSEDGQTLYFWWNPERAPADSLYQVSRSGGTPEKVPAAACRHLPSPTGVYNRSYTRKVFEREGDIFLHDITAGRILAVTNTTTTESAPRFSFQEDAVIYVADRNLFAWEIASGRTTQLTDFRAGTAPEKKEQKSEAQKYLAAQELRLLQTLRARKERREQAEARNRLTGLARPKTIYLGEAIPQQLQLSPDGRFVTLVLQQPAKNQEVAIVPNYITETGFTGEIRTREKVGEAQATYHLALWETTADTLCLVKPDSLPEITAIREFTTRPSADSALAKNRKPRPVMWHGPFWNAAGTAAFVVVTAMDNKDRWIAGLSLPAGTLRPLDHQYDAAWIGGPGIPGRWSAGAVGWMPDHERIWFCSEATGYSHLYTVHYKTGRRQALTQGPFEIYSPFLSRDRKNWYFTSNEVHPGERHFYTMPLNGGQRTRLTAMTGHHEVLLSPDEKMLAVRFSTASQPWELFLQPNQPGATAQRLTFSPSAAFNRYPWRTPEFITYPARDGRQVHARLYRPAHPNGAAVIFVHGAGYLQNAHKGWSSYFREYLFHNLLADLGYTVLDPDYRASAGYGREWRTAIYRHMGGKDLDDVIDGAAYLVKDLGMEAGRLGIYGGSYGGFLTLMAMFTAPATFAAGAALRPVTDWAHYNHGYTANILNIPVADTLAYRRSSPIHFAEGLQGALLICHGMVDVNVHFQDTVRLVQRLIELGKENWEVAIYPMEDHAFQEVSAWTDEYKRILKLFEENLGGK